MHQGNPAFPFKVINTGSWFMVGDWWILQNINFELEAVGMWGLGIFLNLNLKKKNQK